MKKNFFLIMAIVLCFLLCACGGASSSHETTAPTEPPTAREQLNEEEEHLFQCLITLTGDDFFEPSAVRVMEIGDYENNTRYEGTSDILYGPDTIVVRLQGENRVGGTLNHYYLIALTTTENTSDYAQGQIEINRYLGALERIIRYKAEAGDYAELSDYYTIDEPATDTYNIGNLNRAIAEYWEDMGF